MSEQRGVVATLSYPLPENEYDLQCALNGASYKRILLDLYNKFHAEDKGDPKTYDSYQLMRLIVDTVNSYGLDLWD